MPAVAVPVWEPYVTPVTFFAAYAVAEKQKLTSIEASVSIKIFEIPENSNLFIMINFATAIEPYIYMPGLCQIMLYQCIAAHLYGNSQFLYSILPGLQMQMVLLFR